MASIHRGSCNAFQADSFSQLVASSLHVTGISLLLVQIFLSESFSPAFIVLFHLVSLFAKRRLVLFALLRDDFGPSLALLCTAQRLAGLQ